MTDVKSFDYNFEHPIISGVINLFIKICIIIIIFIIVPYIIAILAPSSLIAYLIIAGIFSISLITAYLYNSYRNAINGFQSKDNSIKVTNDNLPDLYNLILTAANRLSLNIMDVSIYQEPYINAIASLLNGNVFIIISSGLIDTFDTNEELLFVIGHEMGHVKYKSEKSLMFWFCKLFYPWHLEYTADLVGLEVSRSLENSISALNKFAAGKSVTQKIKTNGQNNFVYNSNNNSIISVLIMSHPPIANRINALKSYVAQLKEEEQIKLTIKQ